MNILFKIIVIVLLAGSLCSFAPPTTEISLSGHLKSKSHKPVGGLAIFVKGVGISMWTGPARTDKNGDFTLAFNAGSAPDPISFYCVTTHNDTMLLKRLNRLESDTPEMTFWIK